jgi:hypothetical protein
MSALALLAVNTDLADHMRNGSLYFTWKIFPKDPNPSITAAVFTPHNSSAPASTITCGLDARWLPLDIRINPTQFGFVFDSYPNPLDLINSLADAELEFRPVTIETDGANSRNISLSKSSSRLRI